MSLMQSQTDQIQMNQITKDLLCLTHVVVLKKKKEVLFINPFRVDLFV